MGIVRSWFKPYGNPAQSGRPNPADAPRVPAWSKVQPDNLVKHRPVMVPDFGAAGLTSKFGQINYNPIGAGIVARHRPQASYGLPGQYINGIIFWAPQTVPTSIPQNGLTSPQQLLDILGQLNVQAAVRIED